MVLVRTGDAPPNARRDRKRLLSARSPHVEKLLDGLQLDGANLDDLRAFIKAIWRDRNDWDVTRRRSGLFGAREIKRPEAERQWEVAFGRKAGAL